MSISVREMIKDDLQEVAQLLQQLQEFEIGLHSGRRSWSELDAVSYFHAMEKRMLEGNGKAYVALECQKIIGFIMGWIVNDSYDLQIYSDEMRYGLISEIIVAEAARGKGAYEKLSDAMEDYLFEQNVKRVRVCTLGTNVRMQKAAQKRGYQAYDEVIMEKTQVAHA